MNRHVPGLWKQKPQAWGPASVVRKVVAERFGEFGSHAVDVIPLWERAGNTIHNYGRGLRHGVNAGMVWSADYIEGFDYQNKLAFEPNDTAISGFFMDYTPKYLTAAGGIIAGLLKDTNNRVYYRFTNSSTFFIYGVVPGTSLNLSINVPYSLVVGKKYKLFWQISDGSMHLYIDGVFIGSTTVTNADKLTSLAQTANYYVDDRGNSDLSYYGNNIYYTNFNFEDPLTHDQVCDLSDNPYQFIQPPTFRTYFIPSGAPTTDLYFSGLAYGVALSAGDISKAAIVDGAVAGIATSDGAVVVEKNIEGIASAQSEIDGDATVLKMMSGSAGATATTSNFTTVYKSITGAASAISNVSGEITLSGEISLSGVVGAIASASGQVSIQKYLSGLASAIANIDGQIEVTIEGDTLSLSGSVSSIAEADGGVGIVKNVSGTISADGTIDGGIHSSVSLSGDVDTIADVVGTISMIGLGSLGVVIDPTIEFITVKYTINSL